MAISTPIQELAEAGIAAPSGLHRTWTRAIDSAIGAVTEPLTAVLLVVEVAILTSGVFSRYVLHSALVWTDELATILLLWLAMLGAVIAYRNDAHMRLTALMRAVDPRTTAVFRTIGDVVVALFAIELLPASRNYLMQEAIAYTPALQIPQAYVVVSVFVALTLMLILAVLRLIDSDPRIVVPVVGTTILVAIGSYLARGALIPLGNLNLIVFFVFVVGAFVAIGIPIAFSFGVGTLSYLALTTQVPLDTIVGRMQEGVSNLVLLAAPMFILLGLLIENAGIAKRLVDALASVVGHVRGGLGIVLLSAMYLVSGISGSKIADMAAVAPVLFPEMEQRGWARGEMVALLASSGAMAETIPPSLVLIIIGSVTGVSIAALFTAGLLPAGLAALALVVIVLLRSRHDRTDLARRPSLSWIAKAFFIAIPGLALPVLIRAAVLGGVATATEVSTVGILYTMVVGVAIYREFDWRRMYPILLETSALTGALLLIIGTATSMGWALTQSGFAQDLADALGKSPGGVGGFLALSIVAFIIMGSVLEGVPAIVLFGPLLFPVAKAFGVNEVHYAIVVVLSMGIGLFSPPLGVGYYAACAIGKTEADAAMRRVVPYLAAVLVATIVIAAFPWLSLGFLHGGR
ncbi:MAG TPA: TRAP transporter large permease subunit [Candidatus Binatia bacterium]|nr:TRAP transporter large permease subunit [Candidatus Binatia bacterium]